MKRKVLIMAGTAATLATVMVGHTTTRPSASVMPQLRRPARRTPRCSSTVKIKTSRARLPAPPPPARSTSPSVVDPVRPGVPTGIGAVLTDANPPVVKSVALGNVNGVTLAVGGTSGKANATKDGSTYKISGTASGVDMSNPMAGPVNKSFELDVSCP